jgi:hypothetical protein
VFHESQVCKAAGFEVESESYPFETKLKTSLGQSTHKKKKRNPPLEAGNNQLTVIKEAMGNMFSRRFVVGPHTPTNTTST